MDLYCSTDDFAAQFIDGTLGMGFGVSSSSLLVAIGLAPAVASASVHTGEIVTTLVSGIAHHQLGNVKRELVIPLAIPGVIGGVLGAYFLILDSRQDGQALGSCTHADYGLPHCLPVLQS